MTKDRAVNFLREALAQGPVSTRELRDRAPIANVSWAALRRAKNMLRVETVHQPEAGAGGGNWLWVLPKQRDAQVAQPAQAVLAQVAQSPRSRVITVKRAPQGPDEISFELWRELGSETGTDCPRIRAFLKQRDQQPVPLRQEALRQEASPDTGGINV